MNDINVIYFKNINKIGGVEEFEFQLITNYNKPFTIYYQTGDDLQIQKLRKHCDVKWWDGKETIKCDVCLLNYDSEGFIEHTIANYYYQVIHADYSALNIDFKLNNKITKYIAVSNAAKEGFIKKTGIKPEKVDVCYNPLKLNNYEKKPALVLGSFTRLTFEKGSKRMETLINKLDELCEKDKNFSYIYYIYTDSPQRIHSENVVYCPTRINNITNIMATMDYVIQLSDSESWCYTVDKSRVLGVPVVVTPCKAYEELGLSSQDIILNFSMDNIDEVVNKLRAKQLKKRIHKSDYIRKESNWDKYLSDGGNLPECSNNAPKIKYYVVEALDAYQRLNYMDAQLGRVPMTGEQWVVDSDRLDKLISPRGIFVKVISRVD